MTIITNDQYSKKITLHYIITTHEIYECTQNNTHNKNLPTNYNGMSFVNEDNMCVYSS